MNALTTAGEIRQERRKRAVQVCSYVLPLFPMCSPIEFLGNKGQGKIMEPLDFIGEPGGIRTHDPMIKSHVLYRLSYGLATTAVVW